MKVTFANMKPINALKGLALALLLPIVPVRATEPPPEYFEAYLINANTPFAALLPSAKPVNAFVLSSELSEVEITHLKQLKTPVYRIYHLKGLSKDKDVAAWVAVYPALSPDKVPDKAVIVDWTAEDVYVVLSIRRWVLVEHQLFSSTPGLRPFSPSSSSSSPVGQTNS